MTAFKRLFSLAASGTLSKSNAFPTIIPQLADKEGVSQVLEALSSGIRREEIAMLGRDTGAPSYKAPLTIQSRIQASRAEGDRMLLECLKRTGNCAQSDPCDWNQFNCSCCDLGFYVM